MIVVDTDILIWILRGNEAIEGYFKSAVIETNGYIFITPIQIAEIYKGLRQKEKLKIQSFIESLNVIDIDKRIAMLAGEFMNKYEKSHSMTMADALIGASANINAFKLWTLNKKLYPMFSERDFFE